MSGRDRGLLLSFAASGCAALGYEIVWTRLLSVALGHEVLAVLGVLAGYFGGMALGAAALHERVRKAADPVTWFLRLEAIAAVYAAVSPWLFGALGEVLPRWIGPLAGNNDSPAALAVAVIVSGVLLLPGTFCLGATLPALVEARRRALIGEPEGRGLGRLYAANTIGAAAGVVLTVHMLIPSVGLGIGAVVLAACGLFAAALALRWRTRVGDLPNIDRSRSGPQPAFDAGRDPDPDVANEPHILLGVLFFTGLFGVWLEVLGIRVLGQVMENTIYTFADVLAVYLVGTAIGAAIYARLAPRAVAGRPATVAAALLAALALATVLATVVLGQAEAMLKTFAPEGASVGAHLGAEALLAAAVFGPATMLMGALFAHVTGMFAGRGIGRAYAINTLGCALAPLLCGVWIVPNLGYTNSFYALVYAWLVLFGAFTWFRRFRARWQIATVLGIVATTAAAPSSLVLFGAPPGFVELERRETMLGMVVISEQRPARAGLRPLRRLQVDKRFRMGGASGFGEQRMGHIPLLLQPGAERALFLGVGTGATLGAVRDYPLHEVDAVELLPTVLYALWRFADINRSIDEDPRVTLHAADARRFVAARDDRWDVIIADLYHPGQDGAAALYSREHFEHIRQHLAPGGSFAQWVALHQFDEASLKVLARTFTEVFPEAHVWLGLYNVESPAIVLVGRDADTGLHIDLDALEQQMSAHPGVVADARDLFGSYLLDREALVAFAGDAAINDDLHPRLATMAAEVAYHADPLRAASNLQALLNARAPLPADLVGARDPDRGRAFHEEVARFALAVDLFLRAEGELLRPGNDPSSVPTTAIDGWLSAYAATPDFEPAHGRLFQAAMADRATGERIFATMLEQTPDRPRVWHRYLEFLRRHGDDATRQAAWNEAQRRFGSLTSPVPGARETGP